MITRVLPFALLPCLPLLCLSCAPQKSGPASPAESTLDSPRDSAQDSGDSGEPLQADDVGYAACAPVFPALTFTPPPTSTAYLPVGNGHFAAAWGVGAAAVVSFWDHPMRSPTEGEQTEDRLWDLYPGLRVDGAGVWLGGRAPESAGYIAGTGMLRVVHRAGDLEVRTVVFGPFLSGAGDDLAVVVEVENRGSAAHTVDLYGLSNAHVDGEGSVGGEQVSAVAAGGRAGVLERAGDGAFLHLPLEEATVAAAPGGAAENPWVRLTAGQDLGGELVSGSDVAAGMQWGLGELAPGEVETRGWLLSWAEEGGADGGPAGLAARVGGWLGGRTGAELLAEEEAGWAAWQALSDVPAGMSAEEEGLYRSSLAVLRMAQVREAGPGYGQILASLPPGIWNISWPRDQTLATLALVAAGHTAEAEAAVQFILDGDAGNYAALLGIGDYLVSAARYRGDGREESDGAQCPDGREAGPNVELDDFGMFLQAWEAVPGLHGASLAAVQAGVAEPLVALIADNGLLVADSSIWERHWEDCFPNGRKQFVWSSLQAAAGLRAGALGDARYADASARLVGGLLRRGAEGGPVGESADGTCPVVASAPEEVCDWCGPLDASGVELINLGLIRPESALARGTLSALMGLRAPSGGFRRNDDGAGSVNPYPWYDDQEWIVIDLRMAMAMAATGAATGDPVLSASAEALLDHVTAVGVANYGLLPELLSDGVYTPEDDADGWNPGQDAGAEAQGAHPMAGFGAGAYILAMEALR